VDLSLVLAVQVFRCWVYFFISLSLSAFVCGYLSEDLSRNKWANYLYFSLGHTSDALYIKSLGPAIYLHFGE